MQVSNRKLNLTAQELTCLVACCVDCVELSTFGVRSGITASMETRSSSMTRLEEQLSLLIDKIDQQSEQLQQLTKQQTERVDSVVHRLDETSKHIDAVAGDLDSVKSMVHGRLDEVESSFTNLKVVQEELGERQKVLKAELRDELLHELTAK